MCIRPEKDHKRYGQAGSSDKETRAGGTWVFHRVKTNENRRRSKAFYASGIYPAKDFKIKLIYCPALFRGEVEPSLHPGGRLSEIMTACVDLSRL